MNKLISLIAALFLIGFAIKSLVADETIGFTGGSTIARSITLDSDPIEFVIMILFQFGFAGWIIKKLANKDD